MSGLFKKAVPAALLLTVGLSLNARGITVNLTGGETATVGGWQIGTDPNVSATDIFINGQTLIIQNESATFTNGNPQGISFFQVSSDALPFIEIATNTVGNASGSNWTGFQYTLSGSASFDGITNVFTPPFGTGVNYINLDLSPARNLLTYTGSQLGGSTSNWGSSNPGDDLLADGNPTNDGVPFASFTLDESPQGFVSEVVPVAPAAWQFLVGLLAVGVVPTLRKAMRFFA